MSHPVRPRQRRDVETLCALAREIWRAHYPPIIGADQTEYMLAQRYSPEVIREELEREDVGWAVLTAADGDIIAYASWLPDEAPGEIRLDKLYVHPAHQRQGCGGALIAHVAERARATGAARLKLAVNKRNERAIAAYRKHGFEVREAVVKDIGGGFVMDDYVMEKAL